MRDPVTAHVTVFAISRHLTEALPLAFSSELELTKHIVLTDADPHASNTQETPERVMPCHATQPGTLPPLSWNVLRFA